MSPTTLIAIVPFTALLAPGFTRKLVTALKKQPDGYASTILFPPIILIAATIMLSLLSFTWTFAASLASQKPYLFLFASGLPDVWPWNTLLSAIGSRIISLITRKEGDTILSERLEGTLSMLLSVSITAAAGPLSDIGAFFALSLAAFIASGDNPDDPVWNVNSLDSLFAGTRLEYLIPAIVVPWIVTAVVLCRVVAKRAAQHKEKEQWIEANSSGERYHDEETAGGANAQVADI